jgi:hypothetical protein
VVIRLATRAMIGIATEQAAGGRLTFDVLKVSLAVCGRRRIEGFRYVTRPG